MLYVFKNLGLMLLPVLRIGPNSITEPITIGKLSVTFSRKTMLVCKYIQKCALTCEYSYTLPNKCIL